MKLLVVVCALLLAASSYAAPGSAGRDVLDVASFMQTQETDTPQHVAQVHQLENFLTADDDDEDSEAGQNAEQPAAAEEAAEMWSAGDDESSEIVSEAPAPPAASAAAPTTEAAGSEIVPAAKADGTPFDDLVSIFSALGDKNAAANSRKIMDSAIAMHTDAMKDGAAQAEPAKVSEAVHQEEESHQQPAAAEAAASNEASEETEDALPLVAEDASGSDSESSLVPGVNEGPIGPSIPRTPPTPAPTNNNTTPNATVPVATQPPHHPKYVSINYVKPVYDDPPNSISPDFEVKAVQGRGGWKKAKPVAKDTLGPCNKGDPCPPQPTADNPNPAPTQLQLNKIRADAEIQKQFGDKRVVEPKGWIRPTHQGCEGDCPKIDVSQSSADGKFNTVSGVSTLPVEVRLNCEPKLEGQC